MQEDQYGHLTPLTSIFVHYFRYYRQSQYSATILEYSEYSKVLIERVLVTIVNIRRDAPVCYRRASLQFTHVDEGFPV